MQLKNNVTEFFEKFSAKKKAIERVMSSLEQGRIDKDRAKEKLYVYFCGISEACHDVEERLRL